MGKKQLITVGIIIACIIGGGLYVYFNNGKSTNSQQNKVQSSNSTSSAEPKNTPQPVTNKQTVVSGKYVSYSKEAVAKASGTKILFFYAPWCPQCRATEKSIKNSKLPDNLTIFKVDYDSNQALRKRYGVTLQTTFVKIDDSGNKIKSFIAYDEPTFAAVKRELL